MVKRQGEIIRVLRKFLTRMNRLCPIEKGILFGSYAKGKPGPFSDIDLAVFSREATETNRLALTSLFLKETAGLKLDIQPLVFPYEDYATDDNDFIVQEIRGKGIVVYG